MKIPLNLLENFVKNNLKPAELAKKLTLSGFLVEKIDNNVLEIEITPNRGDALSVLGIAREIAALLNKKINLPKIDFKEQSENFFLQTDIDCEICPRYTYRIIEGIKIGPSPKWLQQNLRDFGFRSVSNVVDITNYVMMELGQPLHAFDYDKITGDKKMIIRKSQTGESVTTLDDKTHHLSNNDIVIENNGQLIDLAGIMGGKNSEVSAQTKTIILQAALFNPKIIRQTSKKLNLATDASYRYERKVDLKGNLFALNRASDLILKIAGGNASPIKDIILQKPQERKIEASFNQINNLLGTNLSKNQVIESLKRLGFKIKADSVKMKILVPSWRQNDIKFWQDIAEEVARIYGYNKIKPKILSKKKPAKKNLEFIIDQKIAHLLKENDFYEVLSYSFLSANDLKILGEDLANCLEIKNPISPEYQYLRPNLFISILKLIAKNPWAPEIKFFEIGNVFNKSQEKKQLILATTGNPAIFKAIISSFQQEFKINHLPFKISAPDQKNLDYFKIRKPISILEIDLDNLYQMIKIPISQLKSPIFWQKPHFRPISKFPPTIRDFAFIINKKISAQKVATEIKKTSPSVFLVELFDEYISDKFGKDMKNLAFHVWLSDEKKTLSDAEVVKISQAISKKIKNKFNAKLRDF